LVALSGTVTKLDCAATEAEGVAEIQLGPERLAVCCDNKHVHERSVRPVATQDAVAVEIAHEQLRADQPGHAQGECQP